MRLIIIYLIFSLVFTNSNKAQDVVKTVIADCFVKRGGTTPELQGPNIIFKHSGPTGTNRRIYLRFDVSDIDTSKIENVKLSMFLNTVFTNIPAINLKLYGVSDNSWDETTVVDPGPQYDYNAIGDMIVSGTIGWKQSTNLVAYIKKSFVNDKSLSLAIFSDSELYYPANTLYFDSKEKAGGNAAKLLIYHTGSIIPEDSIVTELPVVVSSLIQLDANNRLVYIPDSKGNIVPDFSYVGYENGEKEIANVQVVKELIPVSGNNFAQIQAAINEVGALPVNSDGYKGAILLKAGTYKIGGQINITKSGIVLRGEGIDNGGTILIDTLFVKNDMFSIAGGGGVSKNESTRKQIVDSYVPIGSREFSVASGHSFKVGDKVILTHEHNWTWIDTLEMRSNGWTADYFTMNYKREVVAVNGSKITIDAPVVEQIDEVFGSASLVKYTWNNKVEKVGMENLRLESVYRSDADEAHGWIAIKIKYAENTWFRNIEFRHFACSAIEQDRYSNNMSILNCRSIDPIATMQGGRKSPFSINGERNLIKDCYGRGGRHDFTTGAKTAGPNVFLRCVSENQLDENGPHQRWATGILWDNIKSAYKLNGQNRGSEGSGQGWPCGQSMYWNCNSQKMRVEAPAGHVNWVIGCKGSDVCIVTGSAIGEHNVTGGGAPTYVTPISLYEKQLEERLSKNAVGIKNRKKYENGDLSQGIKVFPNPVNESMNISFKENERWHTLIIENLNGQYRKDFNVSDQADYKINMSSIPKGIYILTFMGDISIATRKIIKL